MAPKNPAAKRFITMAAAMTAPSMGEANQSAVIPPVIAAKAMPFSEPTMVSFQIMRHVLVVESSRVARARTATVRACVPAFPPILATIGMRTARATICSIVASKNEITMEAMMAVSRFTNSQRKRVPVVAKMAR